METSSRADRLRAVSRSAFGQSHRLELMLAVMESEDGLCTLTELSQCLNVAISSLQRPFQALIDLGLLTALPGAGTRYRYFARNPSSAWQWAAELADTVGVPALPLTEPLRK